MALRPLRLLDNQRPSLSINRELKNIRLNLSPFFFFPSFTQENRAENRSTFHFQCFQLRDNY